MTFSHLDSEGAARMVDVGEKDVVQRTAVAGGVVCMSPETIEALRNTALPKGDALNTARIAGVMAAKNAFLQKIFLAPLNSPRLLVTRGRVSGKLRRTPLIYGVDQGRFIVVASNGGSARDPEWCLNLRADPHVQIQVGAELLAAMPLIRRP